MKRLGGRGGRLPSASSRCLGALPSSGVLLGPAAPLALGVSVPGASLALPVMGLPELSRLSMFALRCSITIPLLLVSF